MDNNQIQIEQLTVEVGKTDLRLPLYETPGVVSFTDKDILEELGPAQTTPYGCADSPFGCPE